jgi:hypothetical protein
MAPGSLLAVVAVTAILVGTQGCRPQSSPPTTKPTTKPTKTATIFPVGRPLRTYVDPIDGTLHLDGVAEAGDWVAATTFGDLTFGYPAGPDDGTVAVFVGTERVGSLHGVAWSPGSEVKVSPDHRTIAWSEVQGRTGSIVLADVSTGGIHEVGRLLVSALAVDIDNESREQLISVDDHHTVTYGGILGGHSWTPGDEPKIADISEFEYGPTGFPDGAQDVRLNPSSTWGAWLKNPANPDAEGEVVKYTAVVVQRRDVPDTKAKIVMPPAYADIEGLYWESDTDVVLEVHDGSDVPNHVPSHVPSYVRCNVVDHGCEQAPGPSGQ